MPHHDEEPRSDSHSDWNDLTFIGGLWRGRSNGWRSVGRHIMGADGLSQDPADLRNDHQRVV